MQQSRQQQTNFARSFDIEDLPHIPLEEVRFPYAERKPIQNDMTEKILLAISTGKDCLVESATGTGKTLCLLSACLTAKLKRYQGISRVYYFTRTHSQMECIVKQFEQLGYNEVRFALRQSKKGLCGNEQILELAKNCNYEDFERICDKAKRKIQGAESSAEEDDEPGQQPACSILQTQPLSQPTSEKLEACSIKDTQPTENKNKPIEGPDLDSETFAFCPYSLRNLKNPLRFYSPELRSTTEDIKFMAVSQGKCPYALQSQLSKQVELVIMSYKYVLDPLLFHRLSLGLELNKSVLIFDEAHNVIAMAKEENSVHLNPNFVLKIEQHIRKSRQKLLDCFHEYDEKEILPVFEVLDDLLKFVDGMNLIFQCFSRELQRLREDRALEQHPIMLVEPKNFKQVFEQSRLADYLQLFRVKAGTILMLDKVLPRIIENDKNLFSPLESGEKPPKENTRKVKHNFVTTFTKFLYHMARLIRSGELYENFLCALETKRSRNNTDYTDINFVCLSSRRVFEGLKNYGVRSIVFASGTLNQEEFVKDTGLNFVKYFQAKNHLEVDRVRTFTLKKYRLEGRRGVDYSLKITTNHPQQAQIVEIIQRIVACVPYGVLVFFKSYPHLIAVREFMRQKEVTFKQDVFWEQKKNKSEFQADVAKYEELAQTEPGAIFFAVCRGKLSEGYNFKDNLARVVIVVGFPLMSPDCLQYRIQEYKEKDNKKLREWYVKDASVAVNQAAGRLIRHANDFGCLYLLGDMACQTKRLPVWIRECKIYDFDEYAFHRVVQYTRDFMEDKKRKGEFSCGPMKMEAMDEQQQQAEEQPIQNAKRMSAPIEVIPPDKMENDTDEEQELLLMLMMEEQRRIRPNEIETDQQPVKHLKIL